MVFLWSRDIDPDNCAIPYLTAMGDLLGGAFLALVFFFLQLSGQMVPTTVEEVELASNVTTTIASIITSTY